ncbi:hypothetical protein K7X08_028677 [Anisodus acutangulus]|uniref:Uncharacterized protein n=1 Tax=Anisodus acutangulus TaxID=402998 RepID=A0A9Q1L2K1_9SOLA|nr:hypothetical protein K7X08_028677 [Anisodus acutangulus]
MPSFLPHRISPPSKLVVLNQACLDLPTASSEERKWGDDEEVEVADNEDSYRRLDKGKAPMERLVKLNQSRVELPTSSSERRKWSDDCVEEEAESDEEGYAQITMDFREPRSPVGSIDSDTPIVRLDANILHPRALRMLGFTTKEGLEFEGMTEALTTMFKDPADYVLEAPRARTVLKLPERPHEVHSQVSSASSFTTGDIVQTRPPPQRYQTDREGLVKLNQSCVELSTSSSERRKWGDECVEEEAELDEEGYAQITMDFREPRSPVGLIDSDTPIVRLDANILHPRALRMLGFTTNEGLEFEGMTEALTTMFKDPADYVLEAPRARSVMKQLDRAQELNQSCVELPTSSSERRKWGDDCVEEEAESDEEGYAQITMDFREPRSPVGSIDSDTPIVRLDANILHPRALRMLGFNTKEGLEFEGMTEALTTMFKDPADYVLEAPRAVAV